MRAINCDISKWACAPLGNINLDYPYCQIPPGISKKAYIFSCRRQIVRRKIHIAALLELFRTSYVFRVGHNAICVGQSKRCCYGSINVGLSIDF